MMSYAAGCFGLYDTRMEGRLSGTSARLAMEYSNKLLTIETWHALQLSENI